MKVAYLYDAVYPYTIGGVERRVYEISRRLAFRGHEVHIFGMHSWEGPPYRMVDGVQYHGIYPSLPVYTNGRRSIMQAAAFGSRAFLPFLREHFDIIDCQHFPYFPSFAAKAGSIVRQSPLLVTWHEFWGNYWYQYLGRKGVFGLWAEHLCAGLTPHVVAVSGMTARMLEPHVHHRVPVIPNGIAGEEIAQAEPSPFRSDIVFSGRLIREKGVDLLLRALQLLKEEQPDVRCVVIGDGPERRELEEMSRELGLSGNVTFTGFVPRPASVWSFFSSSLVFVLPSRREGFGMSALEALACGLPVVTIDHPRNATTELVTAKTGRVCRPAMLDLAAAIGQCIDRSPQMRQACIARAGEYEWDRIVGQLEGYYAEVSG